MTKSSKMMLSLAPIFLWAVVSQAQVSNQVKASLFKCDQNNAGFCTELRHDQQFNGHYSGHDEPAILFYSDKPGAGNNALYHFTLPLDPPVPPRQDGTGGTFNFQLHSAAWFGMVLCDTQSSPNFSHVCVPNTDANIFDNADPNAPDFIGHHPGSAFLELQFYPPGGVNTCSDPAKWCVAMVIFSFNFQDLTGTPNNLDCRSKVGTEPSNFAFVTTNGVAQSAADPLNFDINNKFGVIPGTTFQMDPGDNLIVDLHDTPAGLKVIIQDLTAGTTGSMTASAANGFAQVNFVPDTDPANPKTCSSTPYAFHPMYSTSSEHTRSIWTAHTYNITFTDEIGHFELCNAVDQEGGNCIQAGADDPNGLDDDDTGCFTGDFLGLFGLQPVGGCINGDFDFDGASYQRRWPGTGRASVDANLKPAPIRFTSPQFRRQGRGNEEKLHDYSRVAFEADLPGIEFESNPACDVVNGGQGCTNPPAGAAFYPLFTTTRRRDNCQWQLGGPDIPGTADKFGGTSTEEFGPILGTAFVEPATPAQPNGSSIVIFGNYRRVLPENPCRNDDNDDN